MESKSSYREIFKATSVYGGVQFFLIFVSIARTKVVAVLLGPLGFGIVSLFNGALTFLGSLTNFGLGTSAIRDIAEMEATGDTSKLERVVSVFRRLIWFTGTIGLVVTFLLAKYISELTFGNTNYVTEFRLLAVVLLLTQLTSGQNVVMQGLRKIKLLAKANVFSAVAGLVVSLPFYFFLGLDGIVPAIIVSALVTFLIEYYFASRIKIKKVSVSNKEAFVEGKSMMVMGFMLGLSSLATLATSYLVRIYISRKTGVDAVGYYTAGFNLINTYVGMIFTAMGTDYFPRLTAISSDKKKTNELINQQGEIALLILGPILAGLIVFIKPIIIILYSREFVVIDTMIQWATMGIFFKAVSWAVAFLFLAKGSSKLFFWNELLTNLYVLVLNIVGYTYFGITGLGYSFLVGFILYFIQVYVICRWKYQFSITRNVWLILWVQIGVASLCFALISHLIPVFAYVFGTLVLLIGAVFSFFEMNKRIDILGKFRKFK